MRKLSSEKKVSPKAKKIRLGIVGTGGMANWHAKRFNELPGCSIVAACDVDEGKVRQFSYNHGIPAPFTDLEKFLLHGGVDAVVNVTPDRFHAPISLACLKAGKHVLCEKPLATSYRDAKKMAGAAAAAGVIHMVNFSYRNAPAIQKAAAMTSAGSFGRILHVQAEYYQDWLSGDAWGHWKTEPGWLWRLSTAHGSMGVLGDVGVHLLDFASFPVGRIASVNCLLKTFPKAPGEKIGEYVLDANDSAVITATFEGGAVGALQTSRWTTGHRNSIKLAVYGEEGAFRIDLDKSYTQFEVCTVKKRVVSPWKTLELKSTPDIQQRFLRGIKTGVNDQPDFFRGAEIQKALDACIKSHSSGRTVVL